MTTKHHKKESERECYDRAPISDRRLNTVVPHGVGESLDKHSHATGRSLRHIVTAALRDYLGKVDNDDGVTA